MFLQCTLAMVVHNFETILEEHGTKCSFNIDYYNLEPLVIIVNNHEVYLDVPPMVDYHNLNGTCEL